MQLKNEKKQLKNAKKPERMHHDSHVSFSLSFMSSNRSVISSLSYRQAVCVVAYLYLCQSVCLPACLVKDFQKWRQLLLLSILAQCSTQLESGYSPPDPQVSVCLCLSVCLLPPSLSFHTYQLNSFLYYPSTINSRSVFDCIFIWGLILVRHHFMRFLF